MMRPHGEQGFTLIELLVAMALSFVVMAAVIGILTVFLNDTNYDQNRDSSQSDASGLVDRMSRDLRSAAAANTGSYGLLERAQPYDLEFETVNPNTVYGGSNTYNQYRIRYCLDSSDGSVWRQTETWTTSSPPAVPSSTTCPDTSSAWVQQSNGSPCCVALGDVTNELDGDTSRPLFTYGPAGYTDTDQIEEVEIDVVTDRDPGHLPGPSPQLTSGVFLRNENSPPTSMPNVSKTSNGSAWDVTLDGSESSDPNGQTLTYQWYANSGSTGCTNTTTGPSTGSLSTATSEVSTAGPYSTGTTETFALVVTDTEGLTNCQSQMVTF